MFSNPNGEEAHPMGMATEKLLPPNLGGLLSKMTCSNPCESPVLV